ncbi:hypothetical protein [Massilia sp. GCM10023247]|uniref:hypothetical protein n=1 Tax=Massilia sp. GCM10023247 TaxID=3252643 RepID=UPI0036158172
MPGVSSAIRTEYPHWLPALAMALAQMAQSRIDIGATPGRPPRIGTVASTQPAADPQKKAKNITAVNDSENWLQQHRLTFTFFPDPDAASVSQAPGVKEVMNAIGIAVVDVGNLAI